MQSSNKTTFAVKKAIPRFSKSDHEALAEIFKKIGHKEQTQQVNIVGLVNQHRHYFFLRQRTF